ncbi:MAG: putative periplasmic esterase [Caulobacter sp.]|jgi:CubicO group peptidase (beta-lactamase class C family)|nr:putative periplasmic esterase [Caulobacter sp.]
MIDAQTLPIAGTVAPGFEAVRDAFVANFHRDGPSREVGAALCVYHRGQQVVDLWGGHRDAARRTPWTADTLVNVWSTTKGVTAIALARLVDEGRIDYAAPVAHYWPEFAQNGKGEITVAQLLSHQAGLPGFELPMPLADFYDWETVTCRLAAQAPMWPPGTKNSYHAMTYGFLAGELIRRVSGLSVRDYLQQEVAGPLGCDIHIGLAESEEHRVAPILGPLVEAPSDPAMPPEAMAAVTNPNMEPTLPNDRAWRAAQIPAGNGQATARGLARLYGAVAHGGTLDGVKLMSPATIAWMTQVQTERPDLLLGLAPFWAMGLIVNDAGIYGPRKTTFGHSGWGGSFGCADANADVAIGYVMNQMGPGLNGDPRATSLCDAVFAAL